ncbi:MAG: hypothetical protein WAP52_01935 [Candidatus Sungiibacteriota bacterium]
MADLSFQQSSSFASRLPLGLSGMLSLSAIGIGLFAAVLTATIGLGVLNQSREQQKAQFIEQNKIKEESLRPELLNQIVSLETRLKNARALLTNHPFVSNVFRVLEQDTHPQVRFSNFSFGKDGLKVDLSGEAASYRVLARQIGIFEKNPQIQKVDFGGLSTTSEGLVGFKLTLVFSPSLLQLRPEAVLTHSSSAPPPSAAGPSSGTRGLLLPGAQ